MALNIQNLPLIDEFNHLTVVPWPYGLKYAIFDKSLNFQIHGTPLTADAARNAVRTSVKLKSARKLIDMFRDLARPGFLTYK